MTQSISVSNPFDGSFIQDVPLVAESKIETALEKSFTLFSNRKSWIPPYERIAILERLAVLLERNKERLIALAIAEGGKPYRDTFIEVERAISGVSLGVQAIHELHGKEIPMGLTKASQGFLGTSFREPRGVVVSFSAFNHPINLVIHQTVPAIAAGAPVIIKPSPATPLSCFEVVKLIHEAGLPEHWCQTFLCSNESAEKMVCDHRISYLSFIGSSTVGWQLRSLLAPGARCALEHGGVAPVLIHDDVELETIIPNLLKGAFYHAGQVCISAQKVFIPKAIFSKFCDSLLKHIATLKVGDPTEESTDVGPLIKISEIERVASWVENAVASGAQLLVGGKRISETCYQPTVLLNPGASCEVSSQEIFGPVLCLYSYQEVEDAIQRANSLPFTFQASVFSQNLDFAMHAVRQLKANAVIVNSHPAFRVDWMPFYGRELSGLGVGGIPYAAEEMSAEKLMIIKSAAFGEA